MLNTLSRLDEATGTRKGVPNWLSTHPAPADRVQQVQPVIAKAKANVPGQLVVDEQEFLTRIDGIIFGDSPKEGIVRGNQFLHPELRLALTFPQGWEIVNTQAQVGARKPEQNEFVILQLVANAQGSLEQVARSSMADAGFRQLNGQRGEINGLDAYIGTYQGTVQGLGNVGTLAAHILYDRRVYLLAGLAPANVYDRARQDFTRALQSFRALSASEAAQIRPNRVDLITARAGDTWQGLAERTGNVVKPSTLAIMNNYDPNQPPRPGDRIKIVVEG
jgi:predicted Zn-dependent protease